MQVKNFFSAKTCVIKKKIVILQPILYIDKYAHTRTIYMDTGFRLFIDGSSGLCRGASVPV